jgi:hypothetical protein
VIAHPPMLSVLLGLVLGIAVAAGNWFLLGHYVASNLQMTIWLLVAPPIATVVTALLPRPPAAAPAAAPAKAESKPAAPPPPPAEPPENAALRFLATLQEEGRLVDFLSEDIGPYSDEQIGAATRGIHEQCRKALHSLVTLEPVLDGREDDSVTVAQGFDPAAIRLVGNVHGQPPFTGTLRHAGWRVTKVHVPDRKGLDPKIVSPAEVEIA